MVVSCCVCSDIQQSSFGLLCAHNLESIDPISSASPAGKWAGQCLYRRFQGILNDKTLFILVFLKILFLWKVKIKFWFWFIYLIQFVLQVQRVRIFHNFSLVEWENSFVPANPHRTSRLSSSRAVGHVGVIFFSCGCFYLKVSCPLRSRCRQHITFRGDDDDDDRVHFSLTANSPSDTFLFSAVKCRPTRILSFRSPWNQIQFWPGYLTLVQG